MNPWYPSDPPSVSPSRPFIPHINSVLTMTVPLTRCPHPPPPPPTPLTEISETPEQSWQQHGDCSRSPRTSLQSVLEGDFFYLFICLFCTWCEGKKKNINRRVIPHSVNDARGRGRGSGLTQSLHVEGRGQQGNCRGLPGGWLYQRHPGVLVGIITSYHSKVQCCNGAAGPGAGHSTPSRPSPLWPQEWVVTHVFLPEASNIVFFCLCSYILKGQQLPRLKTSVWIGANMTSEKGKRTMRRGSAGREHVAEETIEGRPKKREARVFFSSAGQIEQEVHVSESGSAETALEKSDN